MKETKKKKKGQEEKEKDLSLALWHVYSATLNSEGNFSLLQFYKTHTRCFFSFLAPKLKPKKSWDTDTDEEH